jgi:hypothetical protein
MRDPMVTGARTGITERELQVLRWVGEQYAVPMALLADLVGDGVAPASAPRLARRVAERLERLGYADRRPLLGQQWLIPSRTGLRAAGLPYGAQMPAPILLRHIATVARLRLHLTAAYPAILLFRAPQPAELAALAGSERVAEGAWRVEGKEPTGRQTITMRSRARVDQDAARRLPTGRPS